MTQLDQTLLRRASRAPLPWQLTEAERIAINVLKRDGVSVAILAKVFKCSRNTIYSNCLTGTAPSYAPTNAARETNDRVDEMGIDKARETYVTPAMTKAVNEAHWKKIKSYRRP